MLKYTGNFRERGLKNQAWDFYLNHFFCLNQTWQNLVLNN